MSNDNSSFQFGIFGYNKKDVELKFDLLKEQYESERNVLLNEKHELEKNVEELRKKEEEFDEKNSRFEEVEGCVSSIMSVTQRASERVFEEANSQKDEVVAIISDTADQIAGIRQEIANVRSNMNHAIDDLQDRLNIIDKTLVNSVSRLISVKHDILNKSSSASDIKSEVERLLHIAGRDIDITAGLSGDVPPIGKNSSSIISESATRVMNSRKNAYYGLASDRTDDGLSSLVEQVDYQLAEVTADNSILENSQGFLNSPVDREALNMNLTEKTEDTEEKTSDDIDMDEKISMESDKNTKDYGLFDIEPADSVPASSLFSDPDWFTSSPLISNDKKPKSAEVKKPEVNKVSVRSKSAEKKVKVKIRKY